MGDIWTPREGAYGRTRDGQRVGPIERGEQYDMGGPWPFKVDREYYDCRGVAFSTFAVSWFSGGGPNDLVAEWTDSPVRIVTRREIVPGTYGLVLVHETFKPAVLTHITMNAHDPSPDELDAAARVLTELAEALRRG